MDSSRLPGKALLPLAGMPLITRVHQRLRQILPGISIVLATTQRSCDDPLAEAFQRMGGLVYRGGTEETNDVASRFVSAARLCEADYALRVNGDSPFPSGELFEAARSLLGDGIDLVTNIMPRSYPYGVSIEAVRVATLAQKLPHLSAAEREHVTAVFYAHPEDFRIKALPPCQWETCPLRLTVDEREDLGRMEQIFSHLGDNPELASLPEIIAAARRVHQ